MGVAKTIRKFLCWTVGVSEEALGAAGEETDQNARSIQITVVLLPGLSLGTSAV